MNFLFLSLGGEKGGKVGGRGKGKKGKKREGG